MSRITTQDLLLSGWHSLWFDNKQSWAHPELSHNGIDFHTAARLEKAFRELKERAMNHKQPGDQK